MCRAHKYFRILYLGGVPKLTHYFDVKGAQIFQNAFFRGVQTFIIYYFDVRELQGYPLCAIVFVTFFKKGLVRKSTI